jgi:hypothetical protein
MNHTSKALGMLAGDCCIMLLRLNGTFCCIISSFDFKFQV